MSERPVRVVGAGFSGLVTAYALQKRGLPVELYEAESKPGGLIQTLATPHGLVETAANAVLNSAAFEDLARDMGVTLVPAKRTSRKRYILREGIARRWPLSFGETLRTVWSFITAGFSAGGRKPRAGENIESWGQRVFGESFTRHVLTVALQGIYVGDVPRMSASLIVGRFFGPKKREPRPQVRGSVAPVLGMGELILKLRNGLIARGVIYRSSTQVNSKQVKSWKDEGSDVVLAIPPQAAASASVDVAPQLSHSLKKVPMKSVVTVTVFFAPDAVRLEGFGCLFPRGEGYEVLGILFNSFIFDKRSSGHSETWIFSLADRKDEEWIRLIRAERKKFYGADDAPLDFKVTRWPQGLPEYNLELERLVPVLKEQARQKGLWLSGNYLGSLGLARILVQAEEIAADIYAHRKEVVE